MKELTDMISGLDVLLKGTGYETSATDSAPPPETPETPAEATSGSETGRIPATAGENTAAAPQQAPDVPPATGPLSEADKIKLAFELGLRDDYVKAARKQDPEYGRAAARDDYARVRKQLIADGTWKNRPGRIVKESKAAATPAATETPPPDVEGKLIGPSALLDAIGVKAAAILKETEDPIKAIKYIREATSFELLTAKMWSDMLIAGSTDTPIPLQQAKDEFVKKLLSENGATLDDHVQAIRQAQIDGEMDKGAGKIGGQIGQDMAGEKNQGFVQIARGIARRLAATGPITIDHVTAEMGKLHNVIPEKGKRKHQWKGSVFNKSEFQYIGDVPSAQKSAHARPVGLWALKSWLKDNTLNGKSTHVSSFVLSRLYTDFKKTHPKTELVQCNCFVGDERLSADIREVIVNGENTIYGMPVTFCPGAVGAMIVPPNPAGVLTVGAAAAQQ